MVSDHVYNLCLAADTVSSQLATNPDIPPGEAVKKLYSNNCSHKEGSPGHRSPTPEDLKRAYECGKWGTTRPSELYLRIYHDVLCALDDDVMLGMVSPPLLGGSGVIPLSIMSTVADNARHMANLIARAEKEVILCTNFWAAGEASGFVCNAIRELSRRAGARGVRAVVKVMYDRGSAKQLIDTHQVVAPSVYTDKSIGLPGPAEIPHVDMQVINYHRPVLGTFHAKYVIVDRKMAVVCSCNIQDTDNMEMSCHIEGPIVDSVYDMALISWHKRLEPPLPSHATPAAIGGLHSFNNGTHSNTFNVDGSVKLHGSRTNTPNKNEYEPGIEGTAQSTFPPVSTNATVLPQDPGNTHEGGPSGDHLPSGDRLPEHTVTDPHYDCDVASEVARVQSVVSPSSSESRMAAVTRHLNTTIQPGTKGDAPECAPGEEMTPYIPHPVHEPFPMAMVNRRPYGHLSQGDVCTPQNEAWLSAIRNAERTVFIQTPDMNAQPLIPELLNAVRRGVKVTCYLCLGYNDSGELLPMQGGTNEMVINKMYTTLEPEHRKNLHVAFYVGKDMTKPINNKFKRRSCHIKLMIIDSRVGIQGSGNQDTQSWFHSQEINILLESSAVCAAWEDAIRRNQNTHIYGWVSQEDGVWRDAAGNEAAGSIGLDPGKFSWAKGVVGAVERMRGVSNHG